MEMTEELKENQRAGYQIADYKELTINMLKDIEDEEILWKIYSFVKVIWEIWERRK